MDRWIGGKMEILQKDRLKDEQMDRWIDGKIAEGQIER